MRGSKTLSKLGSPFSEQGMMCGSVCLWGGGGSNDSSLQDTGKFVLSKKSFVELSCLLCWQTSGIDWTSGILSERPGTWYHRQLSLGT